MIVAGVLVVILLLVPVGISLYFYHVGIARTRKDFLAESPDLQENFTPEVNDHPRQWMESHAFKEISLTSADGLRLAGYYLPAPTPTHQTALLVHGYASRALDMGNFAYLFYDALGFNVLAVDCRGHGHSQGQIIGFGWPDRKDLSAWIAELVRRDPQVEIILMGISMGGAAVLMTSGEDLPANVKGILSDCAYTSAREILSLQLRRMYHLPAFPIIPLTSLAARLMAGYYLGEASALGQVTRARQPILFIHGAQDTFVPTEMVHRLVAACPTGKEVWLVPGAGHGLSYQTDPQAYTARVAAWVDRLGIPAGQLHSVA